MGAPRLRVHPATRTPPCDGVRYDPELECGLYLVVGLIMWLNGTLITERSECNLVSAGLFSVCVGFSDSPGKNQTRFSISANSDTGSLPKHAAEMHPQ